MRVKTARASATPEMAAASDLRCYACTKLLARMTTGAIRGGAVVQIKCTRCGAMNHIAGTAAVDTMSQIEYR
jgi:phage FluMu protein Com